MLIVYLDSEDPQHARAETLLAQEIDDDFAANTLALAEVLVMPARQQRLDEAGEAWADLDVNELAFPPGSAVKLAHLRPSADLKMPACCALLAAEDDVQARVPSFDDRLRAASASRNLVLVRD